MNAHNIKKGFKPFLFILAFSLIAVSGVSHLYADNVVLRPGYISGTIQVGSEIINTASISASWSSYSASTSISPNATSGTYTLTVNVPEDTTPSYTVNANASMNGNKHRLYFEPQSVSVSEFSTSTANFVVANPGVIEGTITVNDGSLSSANIYAYQTSSSAPAYTNSRFSSSTSGYYSIPVVPNNDPDYKIRVYGYAYVEGTSISLPSQYVNVSAGGTVTVNWEVTYTPPPQPSKGNIAGTIAMNGDVSLDRHYVYTSSPYTTQNLYANGSYSLNNVNVGSHTVTAYSYFNNNNTSFTYPYSSFSPNRYVTVEEGATTTVDISADAAFLKGDIKLTGTASLADAYYAYLYAYGVYGTDSYGGNGWCNIKPETYNFVLSEGSWTPYYLQLWYYNTNPPEPEDYLYQWLYFYDYQVYYNPTVLTAGQTVTKDIEYATGTVTVNFYVLAEEGEDPPPISRPQLNGTCRKYDENDQLVWQYNFNSYNYSQQNVEVGSVTFVGMEGECTFDAYAYVLGSYVKFGTFTVDVVPGAQQVIDIYGPTLTVEFPDPGHISSDSTITVYGTATDDVEVATVTVNGVEAGLTSTGNPDDPNEVSFSADIELSSKGLNEIVTVATDTSDKTATDTRSVCWDEGPPILTWTPADGSITSSPEITVEGTATDDAGITSISVNGEPVDFESTYNPNDPNEVSFSADLWLDDEGAYDITVEAEDICTGSATETHTVTYTLNRPPDTSEAYADADCLWPPNHKFVEVSIEGVTDPDGDPVTITIDAITSDEPTASDKGSGGAKHAPDASGIGSDTASLRAERSGDGDGRVYVISFTASDGKGGGSTGSVVVKVPHDQSSGDCPAVDSGQDYDATELN